ncbi:hypothetical protein [Undibacterium rugosum]|uniref:hypothetical protein n=1 Tax=Undibacterium rugosum TaxID=2762291 RepID=UPI001B82A66E|nr:hypothetical protein [Undibacterium rugosum]MBR7780264.1 hypothetical protein [Undibacterium rugosum]
MLVDILGYFAQVDVSDKLIARTNGEIINYRLPSYGRFIATTQAHYFFGIVKSVNFPGVMMDVDNLRYQIESRDSDLSKRINFMRAAGAAGSSAEHAVPELIFSNLNLAATGATQPQAVSAIKALTVAASEGQKIYTLNQSNQRIHSTVLQSLQVGTDVKMEISDALVAGKEVTIHEKDITVNGWTGNGYIIFDSDTGAGAYKIAGGANGAILFLSGLVLLIFLIAAIAGAVPLTVLWGSAAAANMSFGMAASLSALASISMGLGIADIYGYDLLATKFGPAFVSASLGAAGAVLGSICALIVVFAFLFKDILLAL